MKIYIYSWFLAKCVNSCKIAGYTQLDFAQLESIGSREFRVVCLLSRRFRILSNQLSAITRAPTIFAGSPHKNLLCVPRLLSPEKMRPRQTDMTTKWPDLLSLTSLLFFFQNNLTFLPFAQCSSKQSIYFHDIFINSPFWSFNEFIIASIVAHSEQSYFMIPPLSVLFAVTLYIFGARFLCKKTC